uniref:Protein kinase domain-containing protein n=1 Tax=Hyaloperonospora arabidopsidis (strain Emoy2) TaxID=559515 RepID=M4BQ70_HYAAE
MWWWWLSRCTFCSCHLSDVALSTPNDIELHLRSTSSPLSLSHTTGAPRPGLYTARHHVTQELVALQVLDRRLLRDRKTRRRLRQEVQLLQLAKGHENLLQLHEVKVVQSRVELTFELARGGQVLPKVQSERDASHVVQQTSQGLLFLHEHGIIHGQVRPEYLLYSEDEPDARVLLVAFGRAAPWKLLRLDRRRSTTETLLWDDVHHVHFVPPFLLRRKNGRDWKEDNRRRRERRLVTTWREAQQVDVWALGVTLYVMLCGCYPFSDGKERDDSAADVERRVLNGDLTFRENGARLSRAAKDLLRRLLEKDPDAAMSIKDVAAHPWLDEAVAPAVTWSADRLAQHHLFTARYAEELAAVANRSSGSTTSTTNVTDIQMEGRNTAAGEVGALPMTNKGQNSPGFGSGALDHDTLDMDTNEEGEEDARPSFVSTHGAQLLLNEEVRHERPSADSFMRLASVEMGINKNAETDDDKDVIDISSSPDAEYDSVSATDINAVGDGSRRKSIDKLLLVLLGQRRFFSFKSMSSGSSSDRS